jgi:hypothetical protein
MSKPPQGADDFAAATLASVSPRAVENEPNEDDAASERAPVATAEAAEVSDAGLLPRGSMRDIATEKPAVPEFRQRGWFAELLISVFGLIALATPLLLWISWTQEQFEIVFGLGVFSIAVCYCVVHFSKAD